MTVIARQFSIMSEAGYENYVPSCVTSFGLYTEILDTWHHFPESLEKTRKTFTRQQVVNLKSRTILHMQVT